MSAQNILETYCKNETNEFFVGLAKALLCLPKSNAIRILESFLLDVDKEFTVGDIIDDKESCMFELISDKNTYVYCGIDKSGKCLFEKLGAKELVELDRTEKVRRIF